MSCQLGEDFSLLLGRLETAPGKEVLDFEGSSFYSTHTHTQTRERSIVNAITFDQIHLLSKFIKSWTTIKA